MSRSRSHSAKAEPSQIGETHLIESDPFDGVLFSARRRTASRRKLLNAHVDLLGSLGWAVARTRADGSVELNSSARADLERRRLRFDHPKATEWTRLQEALGADVAWADLDVHMLVWHPQQRPVTRSPVLTSREVEVKELLQAGKSAGEIATILQRSRRTIEKHQQTLYRKLGVTRVDQLILSRQT